MIHGNSKMTVIHTMRRLPWGDCNIAPLTVTHFRGTNASQFRMLYFATNSCMHLLTRFWIWSQPKIRWPLLVMRPQSYRANHYIRHLLNSCSQSDQSVTHSGRAQINGSVLLPVVVVVAALFLFPPSFHFILGTPKNYPRGDARQKCRVASRHTRNRLKRIQSLTFLH